MIWGETYKEASKRELEQEKKDRQRIRFAWFPIILEDGRAAWLVKYRRRFCSNICSWVSGEQQNYLVEED